MQEYINNNRFLTLADLFLIVLEHMAQEEEKKAYVRKVRTLMDVPECAEFMSCCVINAMGIQIPIAVSTIDKAVDCLIHFYEDNIEDSQHLSARQKLSQKVVKKEFMSKYRKALKNFIASKNLLIY